MTERVILHVDMDAFYASIEQRDHPEYRGRPVIVGAPPDRRGVVSAASYEARRYGVHSAMPSSEAGRRCPHGVFLPVDMQRYVRVSRQVRAIFDRFTPLVEPLSIDEAFLDVTGSERLFGAGPDIAAAIKSAIHDELGLTASVGVAGNKFLAKLASDLDKPDGLTVVPTAREAVLAFLAPLPVGRIWGVGRVMQERLAQAGIDTIDRLQQASQQRLAGLVGAHAALHLQRLARGEDAREVELEHEEKSISKEHTFDRDCSSRRELEAVLNDLVDDVGRRLRAAGKYARLARLKLRWQGFKTITRQRRFDQPVCDDFALRRMAQAIFAAEDLVKPVRLIGFGVAQFAADPAGQLELFDAPGAHDPRTERLSKTVDDIRRTLGADRIRRGSARE